MGGTRENEVAGEGGEGGHGTSPNPEAAQLIPPPVGACPTLSGSQASLSKSQYPRCPPQVSKTAAGLWGGPRGLPLTFVLFLGNTALPQA